MLIDAPDARNARNGPQTAKYLDEERILDRIQMHPPYRDEKL